MRSLTPLAVFCACAFPSLAIAGSSFVPADLSSAFDPESITLQVNFNGKNEFGFADGSSFDAQQTKSTPVYALGDASGINTAITFLVLMVDTTEDSKRILHFLQSDFKATEDETAIASSSSPLFAYKSPGSLGETGTRKYSFLLYQQPGSFKGSGLPSADSAFDVASFLSANNLQAALAGVAMSVQISSDSTGSSSSNQVTLAQAQSTQQPESTALATSASALSIANVGQTTSSQAAIATAASSATSLVVVSSFLSSGVSSAAATSAILGSGSVGPVPAAGAATTSLADSPLASSTIATTAAASIETGLSQTSAVGSSTASTGAGSVRSTLTIVSTSTTASGASSGSSATTTRATSAGITLSPPITTLLLLVVLLSAQYC